MINIKETYNKISFEKEKAFILILFLGAVLFFQQSWVPGFFQDGYLYTVFGKNAAELGKWLIPFQSESQYPRFDHHPPTLFILEGLFFKVFGSSYSSARIFSGLWSLGLVVFLFSFTEKIKGYRWAFFAAIVLLLCPSLMKKTRFPNLDIPLTFFFLLSLMNYYSAVFMEKKKSWIWVGLFSGMALLIKGLPALAIAFIIFVHLIITKKIKTLGTFGPWLGFFISLMIFGIWPLSLYLTGSFEVFENYLKLQLFGTMIEGRGNAKTEYFVYVLHLLKTTAPWLICVFLGLKLVTKETKSSKDKELFYLFLVWFLSILIPFSFMKFKYSHYIMPLYPALAGMAGYYLANLSEKFQLNFFRVMKVLVPIAALVLLIFPLTTKQKRHKETFKVLEILKLYDKSPKNWYVVGGVFEYWSTSSLSSYELGANPHEISIEGFERQSASKGSLFFLSKSYTDSKMTELIEKGYSLVANIPHKNVSVLYYGELGELNIK